MIEGQPSARSPLGWLDANGEPLAFLTVVYDDRCEVCRRCRSWLTSQEQLVPLRFLAASDPVVAEWAGDMVPTGDELVVVDPVGATWVGPDAFVVCLAALRRYAPLAQRLQKPALRPIAQRVFHAVSAGRGVANGFLSDRELHDVAAAVEPGSCEVSFASPV